MKRFYLVVIFICFGFLVGCRDKDANEFIVSFDVNGGTFYRGVYPGSNRGTVTGTEEIIYE